MIFYGSPYRRVPSTTHPFKEKPVKKALFWSALFTLLHWLAPVAEKARGSIDPWGNPTASVTSTETDARGSIDPWGGS